MKQEQGEWIFNNPEFEEWEKQQKETREISYELFEEIIHKKLFPQFISMTSTHYKQRNFKWTDVYNAVNYFVNLSNKMKNDSRRN